MAVTGSSGSMMSPLPGDDEDGVAAGGDEQGFETA